jgi:tetratricopeptide (TPR) repeat protein
MIHRCLRPLLDLLLVQVLLLGQSQLRADDKQALFATMRKAQSLEAQADYAKALVEYEDALRRAPKVLPANSPLLPRVMNDAAICYRTLGKYDKALEWHQRALKIREANFPADHLEVAQSQLNLAVVYEDLGEYEKAIPLVERSLKTHVAKLGPTDPTVASCLNKSGKYLQ